MEELQRLIVDNGINTLTPIIQSFNEVKKMNIPIMNYCLIQKAKKCFKFLFINTKHNSISMILFIKI